MSTLVIDASITVSYALNADCSIANVIFEDCEYFVMSLMFISYSNLLLLQENYDQLNKSFDDNDHSWTALTLKVGRFLCLTINLNDSVI